MTNRTKPTRLAFGMLTALASSLLTYMGYAQCDVSTLDAGPSSVVTQLCVWDPDGPGPLPSKLVVGGTFTQIGGIAANNVAAYNLDTQTWEPLGNGIQGNLAAFAAQPNGHLIASGHFQIQSDPIAFYPVLDFDGMTWSPIGTELVSDNAGAPVVTLPSGDLVVTATNRGIQRWDGAAWHALGSPPLQNMNLLQVLSDGSIVAAARGQPRVRRFDGVSWRDLGATPDRPVWDMLTLPNGDLVIAGEFYRMGSSITGVQTLGIARWNGSAWTAVGDVSDLDVNNSPRWNNRRLVSLPNGDLLVQSLTGWFGRLLCNGFVRWDGTSWFSGRNSQGTQGRDVSSMVILPNGKLALAWGRQSILLYELDGNAPVITEDAHDVVEGASWRKPLRVTASDTRPLTYYWRYNGLPVSAEAIQQGPVFAGGYMHLYYGTGTYDCVISNGCHAVVTRPAHVSVCYADFDGATGTADSDGGVTIDDLLEYLSAFSQGDQTADLDNGSGTGRPDHIVSFEDLVFFLARYAEGC